MVKAIFLDYTGTILQKRGQDLEELLLRITRNSNMKDSDHVLKWWTESLRELEKNAYMDSFISEEEIVRMILERAVRSWQLNDDLAQLKQLYLNYLMYAPLFTDVKPFFEQCTLPVYIVTNYNEQFVRICLKRNGVHVHGVISADTVNAYKPHKELFEKAVEVCGCKPEEIIHVGNSLTDVEGSSAAGITPILLDRAKTVNPDTVSCRVINRLSGVLKYL